jgi:hypothetical protein
VRKSTGKTYESDNIVLDTQDSFPYPHAIGGHHIDRGFETVNEEQKVLSTQKLLDVISKKNFNDEWKIVSERWRPLKNRQPQRSFQ